MNTRKQMVIDGLTQRIDEFKNRCKEIDDRIVHVTPIHEESIWFQKIDLKTFVTFLETDTKGKEQRIREAYLGRVLKVSEVVSDNEMVESKKKLIKPNDYVLFNSEVPLSPNIPDFYEIWVLSIHNVIGVDNTLDPLKILEGKLTKELFSADQ